MDALTRSYLIDVGEFVQKNDCDCSHLAVWLAYILLDFVVVGACVVMQDLEICRKILILASIGIMKF